MTNVPNVPTTLVTYRASNLPANVPAARTNPSTSVVAPGTLTSTITVPDNFLILNPLNTLNGLSTLTVRLNITDANDPALQASLVYDIGKAGTITVPLFAVSNSGVQTRR